MSTKERARERNTEEGKEAEREQPRGEGYSLNRKEKTQNREIAEG